MDKASSRLKVLAILVALMFIALSTRLWFLQVLAVNKFRLEARQNSVRLVPTDPLRGTIVDDKGKVLVGNRPSLEVRVDRQSLGDHPNMMLQRLADLLEMPVADLQARLEDPKYSPLQPVPVAEFVGEKVADYIGEHDAEFPGVNVVATSARDYPFGRRAAHVLGWVGAIGADEYDALKDQGYGLNDSIGRAGLEQIYEKYLRGTQGVQKYIVNSDGEVIRALGSRPPTAGNDLHLTLDARIQQIAEQELKQGMARARTMNDSSGNALRANSGAVVVLDAKTGGVVAMASLPSYDPRWYVRGLTNGELDYLGNEKIAPQLNRATMLGWIPGSTIKPITALVAMDEGVASMNGSYECTGTYEDPNDTSHTVFTNWTDLNLGYMSIYDALKQSCDTVFYRFGSYFYDEWTKNPLADDSDPLARGLRGWGFGAPTGIDLPGETSGVVPDPNWAQENPAIFPYGWVPGGDILTAIGATWLSVSPLQLASAYQTIADDGVHCTPHLLSQITDSNGQVVKSSDGACKPTNASSSVELSYVRDALAAVVSGGTATCAFTGYQGPPVAGKTGTAERAAQNGHPMQDTSWFASMVPAQDPQYIVVTMVEQGGFGGTVAAPITRRIIERTYGLDPGVGTCTDLQVDR